jgi:hypothetical protein
MAFENNLPETEYLADPTSTVLFFPEFQLNNGEKRTSLSSVSDIGSEETYESICNVYLTIVNHLSTAENVLKKNELAALMKKAQLPQTTPSQAPNATENRGSISADSFDAIMKHLSSGKGYDDLHQILNEAFTSGALDSNGSRDSERLSTFLNKLPRHAVHSTSSSIDSFQALPVDKGIWFKPQQ